MKIEIDSYGPSPRSTCEDEITTITVDGEVLVTVHGGEREHWILAQRIVAVLMTPCPLPGDG